MSATQREDGMLSHISVLNTYTGAPLTLAVPARARVADLKTAIAEQCPGQPRPNGQRIIWKGRVVVDEEVVGDIWEPGEDTHTVHLAVHPSAWSTPPKTEGSASTAPSSSSAPASHPAQPIASSPLLSSLNPTTAIPNPASIAKELVMFHHTNALRVMAGQPMEPWSSPTGLDQASATHWAFMGLVTAGQVFPPILLTSYPPSSPGESGLEYTFVTIDGRPYLSLLNHDASPTPTQQHAIQVLTCTLALIPYLNNLIPPPPLLPPMPFTFQPVAPPPRQSARAALQRMRRLIVALRTLVPLSFTLLRASLFIVFFPQARDPLWLTVIIAVVLYEARLIINRAYEALPNLPNPNDPNPRPAPGVVRNATNNPLSLNIQSLFDRATLSGVDSEAAMLDLDVPESELRPVPEDETPVYEWALRIRSFIILMGVTLVPAAWARRREAMRLREGRVRVVYGERANAVRVENEEGQQVVGMLGEKRIAALQPGGWRRTYVERVLEGIEEHVE
ncbi:transmembrane protein, putative [Rhizoctonia solani AG-3 Rhs1AP]|uniref:Transmembrane protein, putative n=1 Tax=Rhizoctonia solani AG-3 Rhs1AP TaxID=1086054 RepID=A0A0A1UL82_9AGAM|nr:transmembrane protein, putative [Rhizoctonia solani AG-3 Rhs1AP]